MPNVPFMASAGGMQCEAQSAPFSSAKQAICNDAMRPPVPSEMGHLAFPHPSPIRRLPATFYRSANGDEPVREWLKALNKTDRQAIGEDIAYVQYKWPIGKPRVDHLRGSIWEVRSKVGNRIARVLFSVEDSEMILLHAFIKKTQHTDPNDIDLANKRLKEWKYGQENECQPARGQ